MSSDVVRSYEEDVVEKRRRTIHVVDDLTARVSLWHGGRKVSDVGGWTHTRPALDDALKVAKRFSIDASSSLRIRVCEEVTRSRRVVKGESYGHTVYESGLGRSDVLVLRRHVWDNVEGVIETRLVTFAFECINSIGILEGEALPSVTQGLYSDAQALIGDAALWKGLGVGEASIRSVTTSPCSAPKGERGTERFAWNAIAIGGICRVHVPLSMSDSEALGLLESQVDIRLSLDWSFLGDASNRCRFYSPDGCETWSLHVEPPVALLNAP